MSPPKRIYVRPKIQPPPKKENDKDIPKRKKKRKKIHSAAEPLLTTRDIPDKCKRNSMEEQMHMIYIETETWKNRDQLVIKDIRNRYPKEGNIRCVYMFRNLLNGKAYIGQTGNLWARLNILFA